jgi:glutathione reductase (NADPH)
LELIVSSSHFDLIVIGAGSGGVRAARMSAGYGARVAIIEGRFLGGTCVNVGCVPKKMLVYGSHFAEEFEQARGYGWSASATQFNWQQLIANKNREIERLNGVYQRLLENAGVELIRGWASMTDANSVTVDDRKLTADRILIATGGRPKVPAFTGAGHAIVSDDAFFLPELPKSVVVVGGGYIAVEFAGIFAGLGVTTHLIHRGNRLLKAFDSECVRFLQKEMQKKGVQIQLEREVSRIETEGQRKRCVLNDGSVLDADVVLLAIGREPALDTLFDASAEFARKLKRNKDGSLHVDEKYQTSLPGVFALGDIIGGLELTPVALAQAMVFSAQQFGDNVKTADMEHVPTAVFSQPNFASVGLSEDSANEKGFDTAIYLSEFRTLKLTLTEDTQRTLMKLVVDRKTDRVLGAHMVGDDAGEIIQGFAVAVSMGATKADFDRTIGVHPTAAEEFVTMRQPAR